MAISNRITLLVLGGLITFAVVMYAMWFANNFEKRYREVRVDVSPEARRNQFLAAERFISESGTGASSHRNRDIFSLNPGDNDTIFLGNYGLLFLERNHDELWQWLERGGHLIFTAYDREDEDEPLELLDDLGVELVWLDEDEEEIHCEDSLEPCLNEEDEEDDESWSYIPRHVTVAFQSNTPGDYHARFKADRHLNDPRELADVVVGSGWMANLLQYPVGEGRVTILSDNDLFENGLIGEKDHAYLLSRLTSGSDHVWFFYSAEMPSLTELMWRHAPYLMMLLPLLLLLIGWRMLCNSGPNRYPRYDERRNLLEHLDASAQFSWRIDRAQRMLLENRYSVEQAWRRRHPQLNTLEQRERCEWIGEKSGIHPNAIERTLYGSVESEQDFIRATSILQQLTAQVNPAMRYNEP
ncbi:MAG: DUF4350 domain-containing protein [Chromatiales bacterium]|nr:DUF4350 domain-containing protein [Chromatiales bacterium]